MNFEYSSQLSKADPLNSLLSQGSSENPLEIFSESPVRELFNENISYLRESIGRIDQNVLIGSSHVKLDPAALFKKYSEGNRTVFKIDCTKDNFSIEKSINTILSQAEKGKIDEQHLKPMQRYGLIDLETGEAVFENKEDEERFNHKIANKELTFHYPKDMAPDIRKKLDKISSGKRSLNTRTLTTEEREYVKHLHQTLFLPKIKEALEQYRIQAAKKAQAQQETHVNLDEGVESMVDLRQREHRPKTDSQDGEAKNQFKQTLHVVTNLTIANENSALAAKRKKEHQQKIYKLIQGVISAKKLFYNIIGGLINHKITLGEVQKDQPRHPQ